MKKTLSTFSTLSAVLLLLICTQVMNGGLSLISFEQQQIATVLSGYDAVGANIVAKIQRALRFGKPLANFVGVDELLKEGARAGRDLDNVSLHTADGKSVAFLREMPVPPSEMVTKSDVDAGLAGSHHLRIADEHYLLFPIVAGSGQGGTLCLAFSEERLQEKRLLILLSGMKALALLTLVAALALTLGLRIFLARSAVRRSNSIAWLILIVLGSAQLACSGYNFFLFENNHIELVRSKSKTVALLLQEDIEALLQKGLQIQTLLKIERQLESTVQRVPELQFLAIEDTQGKTLYHGGERVSPGSDAPLEYLELSDRKGVVGRLAIGIDVGVVKKAVREIAYDSLTIVALSMLFIMELVLFLSATILRGNALPLEDQQNQVDLGTLARTAIFLFIFAASLCYSFIPLHMADLYRPFAGFSKEMVLGLPLAMEMLGGGLVLIPVGLWIDKKGWHQPFIGGVMLAMLGTAASGLTLDPLVFIAARLVAGIGYGMAWMAAQGYVLQKTELKNRARGISNVVAGIFSGVICGNGMGALLAQRIGYQHVFLIGAVIMAVGLVFVLLFMRSAFSVPRAAAASEMHGRFGVWRLVTDPQALLLFVCSLLPYSIGMVGLLYYITPLYLKGLGTNQSDIGRVIMVFGLCMIFLAPRVSCMADRLKDKRSLIISGGVLAGASLLLFHFYGSFWIVPAAVLLFGVSVAISGASRNVIMLTMPISKELGASQVMGVYRSVDKLGQTLGAMVPATLMTFFEMRGAMLVMGGVYLLLTFVLAVGLRNHSDA